MRHLKAQAAVNCFNQSKLTTHLILVCEGCGVHFRHLTQILTFSNRPFYRWCDIIRVKLPWISPNTLNQGREQVRRVWVALKNCRAKKWWNCHHPSPKSQGCDGHSTEWIPNQTSFEPFIVLTMRHWKDQAAVNCLNQPKLAWVEVGMGQAKFVPIHATLSSTRLIRMFNNWFYEIITAFISFRTGN